MKVVVIGNCMVGYKFCEKLVAKSQLEQFQIVIFGEEIRPAYDRVHLSKFFAGKTAQDFLMAPYDWYLDNNIKLHLSDPVQSIDRIGKTMSRPAIG